MLGHATVLKLHFWYNPIHCSKNNCGKNGKDKKKDMYKRKQNSASSHYLQGRGPLQDLGSWVAEQVL